MFRWLRVFQLNLSSLLGYTYMCQINQFSAVWATLGVCIYTFFLCFKTPIVRLNLLYIELGLSFCSQIGFAEMERRIRMGPIEFISLMGGLFGLCLGFSFISFFEIIYWATIALSRFELKCDRFCQLILLRNNWRKISKN